MNAQQGCNKVGEISEVFAHGGDAGVRIDAATLAATDRRKRRRVDPDMQVALLTGGQDPHYAYGLATALASQGVNLEVLGSESIDGREMHETSGLHFDLLYGGDGDGGLAAKIKKVLGTYARLIRYAAVSNRKVLHILWNYKLELFDRTFLLLFYKLLNKQIVLTAHNVNAARRDLKDSLLNRFTLRVQYRLADHIFVHTAQMKDELKEQFGVRNQNITIIPYGVNNAVPNSALTRAEARWKLGIDPSGKVLLFFGAIKAYKGLEYLVSAFHELSSRDDSYRLIIAGEEKKGYEAYWREIQSAIANHPSAAKVIQKIAFIPDQETEIYFKAADVAVLPYTEIFQSGILFLAYSFGLPVVATSVGSFDDDIVEGKTGFVCAPCDSGQLAVAINRYFASDLFTSYEVRSQWIREYAFTRHSWATIGNLTRKVYADLLAT